MPTTSLPPGPFTSREEFLVTVEGLLHHGNAPVALALSDLDDFAQLNDDLGHDAGDEVLALWERTLGANLPEDARIARLGGDEFAVALPSLSVENALVVFEEIRQTFARHTDASVGRSVAASLGVAANPPHGVDAASLFQAAGQALMRAKRDGGDRVAIYVEEKMVLKSNYYSRANLERLAKLSAATDRTEANLLREALDDLIEKYRERT